MNQEEQRIAIAEACGWEWMAGEKLDICATQYGWGKDGIGFQQLPNYCEDLNAIHEAEKYIHRVMRSQYVDYLAGKTGSDYFSLNTATAAQRVEAFLKTLNLWKE